MAASPPFVNLALDPMSFAIEDMTNKFAFFVCTLLQC